MPMPQDGSGSLEPTYIRSSLGALPEPCAPVPGATGSADSSLPQEMSMTEAVGAHGFESTDNWFRAEGGEQLPGRVPERFGGGLQAGGEESQLEAGAELDPALTAVLQDIRLHGEDAFNAHFKNAELMQKIGQQTGQQKARSKLPRCVPEPGTDALSAHIYNTDLMQKLGQHRSRSQGGQGSASRGSWGLPAPEPNAQAAALGASTAQQGSPMSDALLMIAANMLQSVAKWEHGRSGQSALSSLPGMVPAADMQAHAILTSIRSLPCVVSLADPDLQDCPLIGCSDGFEALTGYAKHEVLGRNLRFLNKGVGLDASVHASLRAAVRQSGEFIGKLPNQRKNGELFIIFLRLWPAKVGGRTYMIGVQADITNVPFDVSDATHIDALTSSATQVVSGNWTRWVEAQVIEFASFVISGPMAFLELRGQGFDTFLQGLSAGKLAGKQIPAGTMGTGEGIAIPSDKELVRQNTESTKSSTNASQRDQDLDQCFDQELSQISEALSHGGSSTGVQNIGSVGHPESCQTECIFYFFRGGCKVGAGCNYCHEYHPRKKPKKNRRVIKRLLESHVDVEEIDAALGLQPMGNILTEQACAPGVQTGLTRPLVTSLSGQQVARGNGPQARAAAAAGSREGARQGLPLQQQSAKGAEAPAPGDEEAEFVPSSLLAPAPASTSEEARSSGSSSEGGQRRRAQVASTPSPRAPAEAAAEAAVEQGAEQKIAVDPAAVASLSFSYTLPGEPQERVTCVAGQQLALQPRISVGEHSPPHPLRFSVEPPLSQGLQLDEITGTITGCLDVEQEVSGIHMVSLNCLVSKGEGDAGVLVPVSTRKLEFHIVDLQSYVVQWGWDDQAGAKMTLKFEKDKQNQATD